MAKKGPKKLTKSALLQTVADAVGDDITRRQVGAILDALTDVAHAQLKKNGTFVLHGFAKFVVRKKPARPARKGINPFTKEPMIFAAKPASKTVRARPVKAIKEAIA
jgi:nucleoid DNA-binding protein